MFFYLQSNMQLLLCIFVGQAEENDAGTYSCQATYATIQEIEARVNDSTLNQQHFFLINLRRFDLYLCPACCGQPFNLVLSNGTLALLDTRPTKSGLHV